MYPLHMKQSAGLPEVLAEGRPGKNEREKAMSEHKNSSYNDISADIEDLKEPAAAYHPDRRTDPSDSPEEIRYPRQGQYTLEDYLALPDEQRVELIDGVFFDMFTPTIPHQMIGGELHALIREFLKGKKGPCRAFISPVDVQLDCDDRTIVQPDVVVLCDPAKLTRARIVGAPDFVVEVLSPSTRAKDILIKTGKYMRAGVREYWMVDDRNRTVTKILPGGEAERLSGHEEVYLTRIYSFDQPVPVSVFEEKLTISFSEIEELYADIPE